MQWAYPQALNANLRQIHATPQVEGMSVIISVPLAWRVVKFDIISVLVAGWI